MPDVRNTSEDFDRASRNAVDKELFARFVAYHLEVTAMMRMHIQDGLQAMQYGQWGGSDPDPTGMTAITRGSTAEVHLAAYNEEADALHDILDALDKRRRLYMSANNDDRNRLDPTEYCRIHFHLQLQEGHKRWKGDLCSLCYRYKEENGHEPTPTEVTYHHVHGRWPHKLYDPKARKAV